MADVMADIKYMPGLAVRDLAMPTRQISTSGGSSSKCRAFKFQKRYATLHSISNGSHGLHWISRRNRH